jgi:hypothetical protein
MDARTLASLQHVIAHMDGNEQLSPAPAHTQTRRRLFPVRSSERVKRTLLRISILADQAGTAFEASNTNIYNGRGAREDFTRLIGTPGGMYTLMNYRTHQVRGT